MKKSLRQKISNIEKKAGNFIYDGLGDIFVTDVSKKDLAGLGLAGILGLGLSGCVTPTAHGKRNIDFFGNVIARTLLEEGVKKEMGNKDYQKRENKNTQQMYNRHFFACNDYGDFNNDGVLSYPNEFLGIKNVFKNDEQIILVSYDPISKKGTKLDMKLFNSKGKEVFKANSLIYNQKGRVFSQKFNISKVNVKPGTFKAVWHFDDYYWAGSTKFKIFLSEESKIKQQKNAYPKNLFTFNKYVDLNNNNIAEKNEFFGLEKRVFDLDKERMSVCFNSGNYQGNVTFRTWTDTGELIGETTLYINKNKVDWRRAGPNVDPSSPPNFMDRLQEAGPGNYKITANTEDGQTYAIDVKTTGNISHLIFRTRIKKNEGDYEGAIDAQTKLIELYPNKPEIYESRASLHRKLNHYNKAILDFSKALELEPNPTRYNRLAWHLSICPDPNVRNGKKAIDLAKKSVSLTNDNDPQNLSNRLDTLAAAYAETGDFNKAIEIQKRVIKINPSHSEFNERLLLYKNNKAYHGE